MKRLAKLFSITGAMILVVSGAGVAFSSTAQAAAESICAAPGNSYCWSQPDTGNAIVLTDTTNIASFTPESCNANGCQLVAVDGACARAQYSGGPVLLYGCGGTTELSEYWIRVIGCGGYYYWQNVGYSDYSGQEVVAEAETLSQGADIYGGNADLGCGFGTSGEVVNQWIWG